mgnify:CR=1 FL=1
MARRKLKHFEEMKKWTHVLEPAFGKASDLPGTWGGKVILELGCGNGDYTLQLAQRFPGKTVVGVDIKGSRLWHGAKKAFELGLKNARFLRVRIEDWRTILPRPKSMRFGFLFRIRILRWAMPSGA